jgi:hypothetical protein
MRRCTTLRPDISPPVRAAPGPCGALGLIKQMVKTALDVELSEHLNHDRGERSGTGNIRNAST